MRQTLTVLAATAVTLPSWARAQNETAPDLSADSGWSAVLYLLLVVLIFAIALFIWFHRKQSGKQSRDE